MKAALALAALLAGTIGAQAMSDRYLAAFLQASDSQPQGGRSWPADMKAGGPIDDVYKCLPELRTFCHDVITGIEKDTTVYEWDEWRDATGGDVEAQKAFAQGHVDDAADRGFNLLTNEELAAVKD